MNELIQNFQLSMLAAQDTELGRLMIGDAVSNTTSVLKKLLKALQVVGFAGGLVAGAGLFIIMMWAGERGRSAVKSHLGVIVIAIIGLFAVSGLATLFKNYATSSFGK